MQERNIFNNNINKFSKQKEQPTKLSSHFLGLECVLDKYQHQNQILSQKVSFLIQENKRLRLGSSYNHSGDYIKYQKAIHKCKDNNQYHLRNTTHTNTLQLKNTLTKLHKQTYHLNVYDFQKEVGGRSKVVVQNTRRLCNKYNNNNNNKENQVTQIYKKHTNCNKSNMDSGRKCQLSLQKYSNKKDTSSSPTNYDEKQTQRYSNQNTNTKIRIKTQPNIIVNTTNSCQSTSKQSYRQATRQQSHRQSNRQSNLQSNRSSNKQPNRQINRQAYLQDQTIFLDSQDISILDNRQPDKQKINNSGKNCHNNLINTANTNNTNINKTKQIDYEKLPIFIQASFGNLDDKQQQEIYQYQFDNHSNNNKSKINSNKNKLTQFSIQSLQKQLKQKNKPNDIHKSNFRLGKTQQQKKSYAKTTYLTSDKLAQNYKYNEQVDKQQDKQNIQLLSGKKTNSPYIKSDYKLIQPKTQLSKIFHPERKRQESKCQNKPQAVCKTKQNLGQPSCMSVKKTFINVMSRKPRINIFQK